MKEFFKEWFLLILVFLLLVALCIYLFLTNPVGFLNGLMNGIMWYLIFSKTRK